MRIGIIVALVLAALRLAIPGYAVNDPDYATTKTPGLKIEFSGEDVSTQPPEGFMSEVFVISSKSGKCPPKAEITLSYNVHMAEPAGIQNLRIFHFNKAKRTWVPVSSSRVNKKQQSISAKIISLGLYVVSAIHINDIEAPKVRWKNPAEGAILKGKEKLTVIATDNVGISSVFFFLIGGAGQSWQFETIYNKNTDSNEWTLTADFSKFVSGKYILEANVIDNADNDTVIRRPVVLQTNAPQPQVTIGKPVFDSTKQAVVVSGTAVANSKIGYVTVTLDRRSLRPKIERVANKATWTYTFVPGGYGPGTHELSAMVTTDYPEYTVEAKIAKDQTLLPLSAVCFPSLSDEESLPEAVVPYEESERLMAAATGGSAVEYQFEVDGVTVKPYSPDNWCNKPNKPGEHTAKVSAREKGMDTFVTASTTFCVKPVEPAKPLEASLEADPPSP